MISRLATIFVALGSCVSCGAASAPGSDGLPAPDLSYRGVRTSKVLGWPAGRTPAVPPGFAITAWADHIPDPRKVYFAPNGDAFIADSRSGRVLLLRDRDGNHYPDHGEVYAEGLNYPYGMLVLGDSFYIGAADAVWKFPYKAGDLHAAAGRKILTLPDHGHVTRNLCASRNGQKLYVAVGSLSNVADAGMDKEFHRANILEINPDGSGLRVYAAGLRNPVGLALRGDTLWTTVNERDMLGADLPPDYLTHLVDGSFYGWPYAYWGAHEDPRRAGERTDMVRRTTVPDAALGAHVAPLGFAFYDAALLPAQYRGGVFVAEHGSWNRPQFAGYKVVYLPFAHGAPGGPPQDFATGFIADGDKSEVYGRPADVAIAPDGALLIADDAGQTIWRVVPRAP
ncbi:MAG TPA: PQQ-dependent sugar dehydrogenase [Nevskiaceae bacterium]|nr:PQQ-dependent sugar dehydrogenase [Nevskiaceae bacterium]